MSVKNRAKTRYSRMKDTIKNGARKAGRAFRTASLCAAIPLAGACSGLHTPVGSSEPDSGTPDSDILPTCHESGRIRESASEIELTDSRRFVAVLDESPSYGIDAELGSFNFSVFDISDESAISLWAGNSVGLYIHNEETGEDQTERLVSLSGDQISLTDDVTLGVGYALPGDSDRFGSAEIFIVEDVPYSVIITSFYDETVMDGDESCFEVLRSELAEMRIDFPGGLAMNRGPELSLDEQFADDSDYHGYITIPGVGEGTPYMIDADDRTVYLAEIEGAVLLEPGQVAEIGGMTITGGDVEISHNSLSGGIHIERDGGGSYIWGNEPFWTDHTDDSGNLHLIMVAPTAIDSDTLGVYVRSLRVNATLVDGEMAGDFRVRINLSDDGERVVSVDLSY
jgi:hypothetical protein